MMRLSFKDESGHLKAGWALFLFSFILLIIVTVVYAHTDHSRDQLRAKLQGAYEKSLYDTIYGMNMIESDLSKVAVMQNKTNAAGVFTNVSVTAEKIQVNLTQLPINHASVEKTTRFVNTLGDFSRYLARKLYKNDDLSDEEKKNISALHETAFALSGELQEVILLLEDNQLDLTQMNPEWNQGDASGEMSSYWSNIENTTIEYPALIYDGPFSQALDKQKPKESRADITAEEAKTKAAQFLNIDPGALARTDDIPGDLYCYNFDIKTDAIQGSISVSRAGGLIDWYSNSKEPAEGTLSTEEATQKALEYINLLNLGDMKVVWTAVYNNSVVLNLTPVVNNAVIYADLVRVKIAQDTGELIGFEGRDYIVNHTARSVNAPAYSEEQAKEKVFKELQIERTLLALCPIGNQEILCWEFTGTYNKQRYIVYIDANTLEEVNVMRVISTESGDLVV